MPLYPIFVIHFTLCKSMTKPLQGKFWMSYKQSPKSWQKWLYIKSQCVVSSASSTYTELAKTFGLSAPSATTSSCSASRTADAPIIYEPFCTWDAFLSAERCVVDPSVCVCCVKQLEIDPTTRAMICELHSIGWGYKRIHQKYSFVSISNIRNTIKSESSRSNQRSLSRPGAPKKLSPHQEAE